MANRHHLAQLRQGVGTWNLWREENPDLKPDLMQADLSGANLNGVNLSRVDLFGANFWETDLSESNLNGADLRGANLRDANLKNANLSKAKLYRAKLDGADLDGAELDGAILSGAILSHATLSHVTLRGVDLSGKDLRWVDLSGKDLSRADLRGANLDGANLSHANLDRANLEGANISKANLEGASLRNANLNQVELDGANLSNADLSEANLSSMRALSTNFAGATFTAACLEDWTINSATFLDGVQCDYVYLKGNHQERRPSSGDFATGEFAQRFNKTVETVDLIFFNPINWTALLTALQTLQRDRDNPTLTICALEENSGAFVVRIKVPSETDEAAKSLIERDLKRYYEQASTHRENNGMALSKPTTETLSDCQPGKILMELVHLAANLKT